MTVAAPGRAPGERVQGTTRGDAEKLARIHADVVAKAGFTASPRRRLSRLERRLAEATRLLPGGAAHSATARASEWLLDNAHLVAESLGRVRDGLPAGFYRRLPRLATSRQARVRELAVHLVARGHGYVDPAEPLPFLAAYQRVTPLTIGELWALPSMLRWVLLEGLADACTVLLGVAGADADAAGEDDAGRDVHAGRKARTSDPEETSGAGGGAAWAGGAPVEAGAGAGDRTADGADTDAPRSDSKEWAAERVAAAVRSLRSLDAHDWRDFFERTSLVDGVLRRDPAGVYPRSDFGTRNACRNVVEETARTSHLDEAAVARTAVELADSPPVAGPAGRDVSFYLLGEGRAELERRAGAHTGLPRRWARMRDRVAGPLYFGAMAFTTASATAALVLPFWLAGEWGSVVTGTLLGLIPASAVGVAVVNWAATRLVRPRILPKIKIERTVPEDVRTVVAVPALLSDHDEVQDLVGQLELNYQGNPLDGLSFVLLADFPDADAPTVEGDDAVLARAVEGIRRLNTRYGQGPDDGPFLLLYRDRMWNEAEARWMGWERKRGKLVEFNRLLLGQENGMRLAAGSRARLGRVRYALSLDADTLLPQGAAARLIGTAGHPLNRAVFDASGRVVRGYTVFQPRLEITPGSAGASQFARLFQGERGLDLYSHAVSDVYQDLFGVGIYAGKGIYDVAAFHRSLEGRVPENAILSHDLFEGAHGRAALVSDVALFEDYPAHVSTFLRRLHRWIRGDWQILPWLLPKVPQANGSWGPTGLSRLGRWQIADNLRRSLLMPSVLLLLLAGWTVLAPPAWWWTAAALSVPAVPLLLDALQGAATRMHRPTRSVLLRTTPRALARGLARWAVETVLLPSRAMVEADAVGRTLFRIAVTRKNLLEWTSAAHQARRLDASNPRDSWRAMAWAPILAVVLAGGLALVRPEALLAGGVVLVAWGVSPAVAHWLGRPGRQPDESISAAELRRMRALAHRTWGFFERYIAPEHHWLPPDHVQEHPNAGVAYRSSPTNLGLGMLSVLGAWDLGYVPSSELAAILSNVMDAVEGLERHRGHLFNWYETRRGAVLTPRFVSTVDSGNLAACLITLARGCEAVPGRPLPDAPVEGGGVLDALEDVWESAVRLRARAREEPELGPFHDRIRGIGRRVEDAMSDSHAWARAVDAMLAEDLPVLETMAVELVEAVTRTGRVAAGAELRTALQRLRRDLAGRQRELEAMVPWLRPGAPGSPWAALLPHLPDRVAPEDIPRVLHQALARVEREGPHGAAPAPDIAPLREVVAASIRNAATVTCELEVLARRADALVEEMDFSFLYDRRRHIFHVGYDVDAGRLASSHYDLLASEARIASFVAIAKGDVPHEHWLHLGRPFARTAGRGVLLSWSGTLFEYLMPELLLRTPQPSLLDFADRAAVDRQIAFAKRHDVPWGTSESAYHQLDHAGTYQYRAFGVPDLAIRRDPTDRIVVAPYASVLALRVRPREVVRNLGRLLDHDAVGHFGFYEALDFPRDNGARGRPDVVRSWMAHHQAMILIALTNLLADDVMVKRFHRDRRVSAAELLLHERVPGRVPARISPIQEGAAQKHPPTPPPVRSWIVEAGPLPRAHLLSNGQWSTLLTDRGSGGARWRGQSLTRWRADAATEETGVWLYVQDLESGSAWSACRAPSGVEGQDEEVAFAPHSAAFRRTVQDVTSRLTVFVAPTVPVEVRCLRLNNEGARPRKIGVTSYGEVVLAPQAQDRRHPAFVKLFIDSEYREQASSLVFRRRPGMRDVDPYHLVHAVVCDARSRVVGWETDRARFLGRTGTASAPKGLARGPAGLSGMGGATLDPIFALGCEVELPAFGQAVVTFLTSAGRSEEQAMVAMEHLRSLERVEWALEQMGERARLELHAAGIHPDEAHRAQDLLTALVYPYHTLRGRSIRHRAAPLRQQALWSQGVSGDIPVLLLRVADADQVAVAEEVVRLHAYLLRRRVEVDLVVLDETAGRYEDPVRAWLQTAVARHYEGEWMGRRGGVHHVAGGSLDGPTRDAFEAAASVVLDVSEGPLARALARLEGRRGPLPDLVPVSPRSQDQPAPPLPALPDDLMFFNGRGGFTADGREYVIRVTADAPTPAPWLNVVANPRFGFTISERGAGFTWSGNSGEQRLTPWSNDPVTDRPGEAFYLRDEETGEVWSPTPYPAPAEDAYEVRHGAGYTTFAHHSHGLAQHVEQFVPHDATVKIARFRVRNLLPRPRRVTVTSYVEWVLGNHRDISAPHVITELHGPDAAVLARGTFSGGADRVAFHASSLSLHGATGDRLEFLGSASGLAGPAALDRVGLDEAFGAGLDPCAALQVHLDLGPEEECTFHFLLGEGESRDAALGLIRRYRDPEEVQRARTAARGFWDENLGRVEVRTPDASLDVMLNRWLPYQAVVCRMWGRSALYQSSGAFGFRDQLQDTLSLMHRDPAAARSHILDAARHQFMEGDVLHWWHPSTEEGVRTRCSDDLLWLAWVTAAYVDATGDEDVLQEPVPFLDAPPLEEGEKERYQRFLPAPEPQTLYEHALRALRRGATAGAHGLPLMGTGDWNDGMDRVGEKGAGESVWLGWFLHACLRAFMPIAERRGDGEGAAFCSQEAERLRQAVEASAWDGRWYRRAYFDDGTPLGTARAEECRIDSLTQSWAVLSGAADPARARQAMASVMRELVREPERLALLLAPPFDGTELEPGYIKAYPPGIRENGGQYTHAAIWLAWAFTVLGDGATAGRLLQLLNPVLRTQTPEDVDRYRVEPYVVAADIYGAEPHVGRGGWTWYTGSSGWLYRLGVEAVLGIRPSGGGFRCSPCIPPDWPGFEVTLRRDGSEMHVTVENPEGGCAHVAEVRVDGRPAGDGPVTFLPGRHEVVVRMGPGQPVAS